MKYYNSLFTLILLVTLLFISQNKPSYSLKENSLLMNSVTLDLEYTMDKAKLQTNIYTFIDQIDDTLIPLYEYQDELNLNDNYQLLTNFALNFISNNLNYYQQKLISGEIYEFTDEFGNESSTNQYVPLDLIYEITSSIFNRKYYYITNKNLTINNNQVPFLAKTHPIEMNIEKIINITPKDSSVFVKVKYQEMDVYYQYEFELTGNKLTIKNLNIEV